MSHLRSRALIGAALTTSAIVAVPTSALALTPAPPSGELRLELKGGAASSLKRQGVDVGTTAPASTAADTLAVPITAATFGKTTVGTQNAGTIVLRKGTRSITLDKITTHQGRRVRVQATIGGQTRTILTALRKTSRASLATVDGTRTGRLRSTRLSLTRIAARDIRQALQLDRLGAGGFAQATGTATVPGLPTQPVVPPGAKPVGPRSTLAWKQVNTFESDAAPGSPTLNRTWLGYFTNSPGFATTRGSFTPSDGATGDTVTPDSPRGPGKSYTVRFPLTSSTAKAATKTGIVRFQGLASFVSPAAPAGHGITVTLQNPRVELNGDAPAKLYATGLKTTGGPGVPAAIVPYDDSQPVFTLDLGSQAPRDNGDGTVTFVDAAPSIAATGYAFPGQYPAGEGPNKTPNTFGTFDITLPAG